MIRAVLWDLDGTLLNTLADLRSAVNTALTAFGCPTRSLEEIRRFVGNGAAMLIRRALPGKADDPDPEEVLAAFRTYYNAHCRDETAPYAGVKDAMEALKAAGYAMAIISNKPDYAVKPLCREHFGDIAAFGEVPGIPRKPAPDMVLRAAEQLGVSPTECIYVGDSDVDVETARNAGMQGLSVLWGFRDRPELEQAGAAHFCEAPADLPRCIAALSEGEAHGK